MKMTRRWMKKYHRRFCTKLQTRKKRNGGRIILNLKPLEQAENNEKII